MCIRDSIMIVYVTGLEAKGLGGAMKKLMGGGKNAAESLKDVYKRQVLLCFGVGADFYAALGVNFNVAWLGIALTGIFASRGANYVSDLVKKLQALGAAKTE